MVTRDMIRKVRNEQKKEINESIKFRSIVPEKLCLKIIKECEKKVKE